MGKYNGFRIESNRAYWHNYQCGTYFVTICTQCKKHYFGTIDNDEMQMSAQGLIANDILSSTETLYSFVQLLSYVVMPNHVHLLITIYHKESNDTISTGNILHGNNPMVHNSLGTVIRGVKAKISYEIRQKGYDFQWQSRYHDHIINSVEELNNIADYIKYNVQRWGNDVMNSQK